MKTKAMLDGKNVTLDWVEEVFDNFEYIHKKNEFLGFVMGNVVYAVYCGNVITWEVIDGMSMNLGLAALRERLEGAESEEQGIYSELSEGGYTIVQSFYFKED